MTCRHAAGDPACSSTRAKYESGPSSSYSSVSSDDYEVLDAVQVGHHLVMKVKYASCRACSYEGKKVMVFLNTSPVDALRWRKIDPHFRNKQLNRREAASPAARFPASDEGWKDAIAYANAKTTPGR